MNRTRNTLGLVLATASLVSLPVLARAADYHHVHVTSSNASEAVKWYERYLDCQPLADRDDGVDCAGAQVVFDSRPTLGTSQRTGIDHISFSYADLTTKMAELESVGVRGSGVRLQRFADGSTLRDVPGLFKYGFIFDPWGTRIEMVEDADTLGFHHIHLSATDPAATLTWYQEMFGGESARLRDRLDGLRLGDIWLLAMSAEGTPAATAGRAIDHIAFSVDNFDSAAARMRRDGVAFLEEPATPEGGRTSAKRAFIRGPDNVSLAVVEAGFAGVVTEMAAAVDITTELQPYTVPRTPWGTPDFQGVWTGDAAHGIPLQRPDDLADVGVLTPEQAAARRERGTLGSIWGYESEWRDTTLGYVKSAPSRQVAMVIDPPDGRIPPMTARGRGARGPQFLGPVYHAEPGADARRLQQRLPDRAGARPCRHAGGDVARDPCHPHGPESASRVGYHVMAGRRTGPLGRRHAGGRHHEFQRPGVVSGVQRHPDHDRALHAHRSRHAGVPVHARRPDRLDEALDRHVHVCQGRDPVRARRVRVSRRQLRHDQHPERRARSGSRRKSVAMDFRLAEARGEATQAGSEVGVMHKTIATVTGGIGLGLLILIAGASVEAHHAFAAEFDANKPVQLTGKITRMEWINPHAWMHIDVERDDGTVESWMIEAGPPGALVRRGWSRESVIPGTEVLVEGYQAIDGAFRANGRDVTFPDGRRLFAGSSGTGAPLDGRDPTERPR